MRTITKINSDKFVQRMNNELVKLGAIKVDNTLLQSHFYELPTRGGKLYVRVDEENKYCFTVFTRFEDVEKASDQIYAYLTGIHQEHSENARDYAVNMLDWKIIARRYYEVIKILPISHHPSQLEKKNT